MPGYAAAKNMAPMKGATNKETPPAHGETGSEENQSIFIYIPCVCLLTAMLHQNAPKAVFFAAFFFQKESAFPSFPTSLGGRLDFAGAGEYDFGEYGAQQLVNECGAEYDGADFAAVLRNLNGGDSGHTDCDTGLRK